jgi:hypothetical protein
MRKLHFSRNTSRINQLEAIDKFPPTVGNKEKGLAMFCNKEKVIRTSSGCKFSCGDRNPQDNWG